MAVERDPSNLEDDTPPHRYDHRLAATIEGRWQRRWHDEGTFVVPRTTDGGPAGKFFLMDMFPYPSGSGLHVGHPLGYIATDVLGRYTRMLGQRVLHTLGYDAFGLPAEQYAIQTGTHPRTTTEANIHRFRAQLARLGLAHDYTRSVATTDVSFYRWTQWIFLQIYGAWYDPVANRARPIAELIDAYAAGEVPTPDGRPWAELDEASRADALDARRLVYRAEVPVNWCPALGTVLANEEVTAEGRSERGNYPVFRRRLSQWMMRITAYAGQLLDGLDELDWPESIKTMQRNWIGRSEGAQIRFPVAGTPLDIEVFTTRPDTLFGATYMVLAPEYAGLDSIVAPSWPTLEGGASVPTEWTAGQADPPGALAEYRRTVASLSDRDRQAPSRPKTGVFTGAFALNPATGEHIPIFVADYVLAGYGTGAIMAVPAHDQRDFEFARTFGLPMRAVVAPRAPAEGDTPRPEPADGDSAGPDPGRLDPDAWEAAYSGDGVAINSSNAQVSLDGLEVGAASGRIISWLEESGHGEGAVTYRLRDWLFSRQRYWGEPFPIVFDESGRPHPLPESMLPLTLPEIDDYRPRRADPDDADADPEAPLARVTDWVNVTLDLGDGPRPYRRETDTMPQWAGSCWYELRYLDPDNDQAFVDPELERFWMGPRDDKDPGGVDLYVGGVEHAVLHLLYARFWHKVLHDLGHISSREPFRRLFNQGYIQAYAYLDSRGIYVPAEEVVERDGSWWYQGEQVRRVYGKMGKSLKNSVTPDEIAERYGADTLRVYEMSMGPLDLSRPWETRAVVGGLRFLQRVWRNVIDEATGEPTVGEGPADQETERQLHATIAAVRTEMEGLRFNTAIARLIELNNHLTGLDVVPRSVAEPLVLMLAPFAPHLAEELWSRLGHPASLAYEPFPVADEAKLRVETVTYPVQIDGRVRASIEVPATAGNDEVRATALAHPAVSARLGEAEITKLVIVPRRIVSIATRR